MEKYWPSLPHWDWKYIAIQRITIIKAKNQHAQKEWVIKTKLKFRICKNCLEATRLGNKINHIEKINLMLKFLKKIVKNS